MLFNFFQYFWPHVRGESVCQLLGNLNTFSAVTGEKHANMEQPCCSWEL